MRRFIHRENIKHFLSLLERTTDESERRRIQRLLAEERIRQIEADAAEQKFVGG